MTTALDEFRRLSAVPRRSYHNEQIISYCIQRAKELGFSCFYDERFGNLLIRKEAVSGKEDRPGIVLQGHLDMVAQTDAGVAHDWDHEGIDLYEEGDLLRARGTTLGADNGVAPAIAFALLSDPSLKNPPLEILFTTDEEVGMRSVKDADLSYLQGKYLLNLDSGVEGVFTNGCCGGATVCVYVPFEREAAEGEAVSISISGLNGGHSGVEIGFERANALKLLGEVLHDLEKTLEFRIKDLKAEGKDNAISRTASCELLFLTERGNEKAEEVIRKTEARLRQIFRRTEPDLSIRTDAHGKEKSFVLSEKAGKAMGFLLYHLPFGVQNRNQELDGGIETSCNLGLIQKEEDRFGIVLSLRSSVAERTASLQDHICSLAESCGAEFAELEKSYPAWLPDPDSPLNEILCGKFRELYGKEATVEAVHAGLECGYILENSEISSAISLGPNILREHTTEEALSMSSLQRTFEFVKAVIESI